MPDTSSSVIGTFETSVDRLSPVFGRSTPALSGSAADPERTRRGACFGGGVSGNRAGGTSSGPVPEISCALPPGTSSAACILRLRARILRQHGVGLALLTEMDYGMLRTGQVHTTARMAELLSSRYAYGLEFLELKPMPPPPGFPACRRRQPIRFPRQRACHGVAVRKSRLIRLDEVADWYIAPKGGQRRVGNRMAVAATSSAGGQSASSPAPCTWKAPPTAPGGSPRCAPCSMRSTNVRTGFPC